MLVGNGPGRGFALLLMVMGSLIALLAVVAYMYPRLRHVEDELPDTVLDLADVASDPAGTRA